MNFKNCLKFKTDTFSFVQQVTGSDRSNHVTLQNIIFDIQVCLKNQSSYKIAYNLQYKVEAIKLVRIW